jgi:hypothetical protein
VQVLAGNPVLRRIAGPIPHVPGQEWNSYLDDGVGAPSMPADASKTFWYTVRSEDDSACGGNLSPNSGPAFGVLRDRVGPAAPGGFIDLICRKPVVFERRWATTENKEQNQAFAYFNMVCDRKDPAIIWAEFYAFGLAPSNYIGRVHFKPGESRVEIAGEPAGDHFLLPGRHFEWPGILLYAEPECGSAGGRIGTACVV